MPKKLKTQKVPIHPKKKETLYSLSTHTKKPTQWQCGVCLSKLSISESYCTFLISFRHPVLPGALLSLLHGGISLRGKGPGNI